MRTQLFVIAAVTSLVAGCASSSRDVVAESKDRAEGETEMTTTTVGTGGGGGGEECRAEQCWDVTADKDLSFVAVEVEGCGGDVDIWLEENGERLDVEGEPHGQGKPCDDQPAAPSADAIKFEGMDVGHDVRVCVAVEGSESVGTVRIVSKAGRVCEEEVLVEGECEDCETGTTSATTGAGGAGGSDTTVTVGVTTGAGGAGGDDTTVTVGATTGGGEGGCGHHCGEGGASTETTTSATTGGGDGGAGQGGMGEGGECHHETDTEVDSVE